MAESAGKMYALATVLLLLAVLFTGLRFWARIIKKQLLGWDDYLVIPALLFTIGTATCMYIGTAIGLLGQHTPINENTGMPIFPDHSVEVFEQITFATQLTTTLTFGFTKMAVLLFYKRVFGGAERPYFGMAIWVMLSITFTWTAAFFLSNVFQCWPLWINWSAFGETDGYCINTNMMYLAQAYSDVFTDAMILSLPIPCIWQLSMPMRHKLAVMGMFLLGALTICASIAKVVVFHDIDEAMSIGTPDITYVTTPAIYWPMVESTLGIVGACLPLLRPLISNTTTSGFMRSMKSYPASSATEPASGKRRSTAQSSRWDGTLGSTAVSSPSTVDIAKFENGMGSEHDLDEKKDILDRYMHSAMSSRYKEDAIV